jgi:hypothetical protein
VQSRVPALFGSGLQASEDIALVPVAAPSEIVAVWEVPLSVAVRVAV